MGFSKELILMFNVFTLFRKTSLSAALCSLLHHFQQIPKKTSQTLRKDNSKVSGAGNFEIRIVF